MSFELPLVEEKVKRHQVLGLHLMIALSLMVSGALFTLMNYMIARVAPNEGVSWGALAPARWIGLLILFSGLLLLLITLVKNKWMLQKSVNRTVRILELMAMLCLASYAAIQAQIAPAIIFGILAAATAYALFWENLTDNTLYIHIDERGIRLPVTSRKRFLEWREVEQVLLRFGILTIDCEDNRLFQWNIKGATIDPEEFRLYCLEHISSNRAKRSKND